MEKWRRVYFSTFAWYTPPTQRTSINGELGLAALVIVFYILHQDIWFWNSVGPLAFGFLPVGLAYHAAYCVAIAGLMWLLVRYAWPEHLEAAERRGLREGR